MLDNSPTGLGVYSFNVINNLSTLCLGDHYNQITVFTPTSSFLNNNLKIKKISNLMLSSKYGKLAAITRFLWNTFLYPLQAKNYDYLISTTTHGSFFLKNQILTIHDLLSLKFDNISAHQRFYYKYFLPFLVSRAKLIVTISETTKKDIIHFLKCPEDKIHVIYNGYDQTRYFPLDHNPQLILKEYGVSNYWLAVGPTYAHKNLEKLIEVYNKLSDTEKAQKPLVIAGGKDPYLTRLIRLVEKLKLTKHVYFLGYVPENLMPSLYREAFALIFPSLYEGFGLPPLEAMACGCPVITSLVSSMPEVCGDAALYINPSDENSILEAIRQLLNESDLYDGLKKKGLARAAKFSWNKNAQALKELLEKPTP